MAEITSRLVEISNLIQGLQKDDPKLYRILKLLNEQIEAIRKTL